MLTGPERERYDRQIILHGFGEAGQEKLKKATVFLAGAGGLGSPAAIYLAAAGVGTLRIADRDTVDPSNLNRQVLHWEGDIGAGKAASAAEKLRKLNPYIKIETHAVEIDENNAGALVGDADVIVDALDNLPARYLLNRIALARGVPFVHGAVNGFAGRAMTVLPGRSACLNCLYRGAEVPAEKFPVVGVTPGVIGCIQAAEVIKYIVGIGELLTDRLLEYDGLGMRFTELRVRRDPGCDHCGTSAGGET
jgi:molybdopterin/thiamine biosynthesis adenylyltransferase